MRYSRWDIFYIVPRHSDKTCSEPSRDVCPLLLRASLFLIKAYAIKILKVCVVGWVSTFIVDFIIQRGFLKI